MEQEKNTSHRRREYVLIAIAIALLTYVSYQLLGSAGVKLTSSLFSVDTQTSVELAQVNPTQTVYANSSEFAIDVTIKAVSTFDTVQTQILYDPQLVMYSTAKTAEFGDKYKASTFSSVIDTEVAPNVKSGKLIIYTQTATTVSSSKEQLVRLYFRPKDSEATTIKTPGFIVDSLQLGNSKNNTSQIYQLLRTTAGASSTEVKVTIQPKNPQLPSTSTSTNANTNSPTTGTASTVSASIAPEILPQSYLSPKSIPNDNKTTTSLYVLVTDQNGSSDIASVNANLGELGNSVIELKRSGVAGQGNWYELKDLKVPSTVAPKTYTFNVIATDKAGLKVTAPYTLEVLDAKSMNRSPEIKSDNTYSMPKSVFPDYTGEITFYVFVSDPDGVADISSVNIDLRSIGLAPVNPMKEDSALATGRYYIFKTKLGAGIVASQKPYVLPVVVVDSQNNIVNGSVSLMILDQSKVSTEPLALSYAVATNPKQVEVVFSKPLLTSSILTNGSQFVITDSQNSSSRLDVRSVTLTSNDRVVILDTLEMIEGKKYILNALNTIKDVSGNVLVEGIKSRVQFTGFAQNEVPITIASAKMLSTREIEVRLTDVVRPSAISLFGDDVAIWGKGENTDRPTVKSVEIMDPMVIKITLADPIKPALSYYLKLTGIVGVNGSELSPGNLEDEAQVEFKGFVGQLRGDLDFDGDVDFNDFTIFSSSYTGSK